MGNYGPIWIKLRLLIGMASVQLISLPSLLAVMSPIPNILVSYFTHPPFLPML